MIDFEIISPKSNLGKFLRFPLKVIPLDARFPILRGQLQGQKWIVGAGRHGCWLGTYEYDKQCLFEKAIKPGSIVFDIGAQAGFYTLLASKLVGNRGQVFSFEPLPRNLNYLMQHLDLNRVKNVTVIEAAVSKESGVTYFRDSSTGYQGGISKNGEIEVRTVSLDDLYLQGKIPLPDYIKMDIEGAEEWALPGAKLILEKARPTIFLAIHGRPIYHKCTKFLESLGYRMEFLDWDGCGELPKNPELLATFVGNEG